MMVATETLRRTVGGRAGVPARSGPPTDALAGGLQMPWVRVDDSFYDHPKLDALGPSRLPCVGLNILALSWSSHWLTDGFIPADRVRKLGGTAPLADRLVSAGLWEREGDDYRIHDFLSYNPSRQEALARREEMRVLGKRGGVASGEARRLNRDASSDGLNRAVEPRPVPSRPDLTRPVPSPIAPLENGDETTTKFRARMSDLGVKG